MATAPSLGSGPGTTWDSPEAPKWGVLKLTARRIDVPAPPDHLHLHRLWTNPALP